MFRKAIGFCSSCAKQVASDVAVIALAGEMIIGVGIKYMRVSFPRRFRITAEHRKQGIGEIGIAPCGCCDQGGMQTETLYIAAHRFHIVGTGRHFVFDLNTDQRQIVYLVCNLCKEAAHITCIRFVIGTKTAAAFCDQPIGKAAVFTFTVCPRTDAQTKLQTEFMTQKNKAADIAVSFKIEHTALLLMMNPEYIRCDNVHTAIPHMLKGLAPAGNGYTAVMHLTHDGDDRRSVPHEVFVCNSQRIVAEASAYHSF